MKFILYWTGRTLQFTGLLIVPSAVWAAEFLKSEAGAIGLLAGGLIIFFIGWLLARIR